MKNKLLRSSALLIIITVISKLLGLIREMVMANYLGTSPVSDAYVLGTTISQIIITGLAGAFFKTYVPIAIGEKNKSFKEYNNYTYRLLVSGTGIFSLISCLVYVTASFTTYWISSGASDEIIAIAVSVCKATAFPSAFLLAVNILQGYLHVQEKFASNIVYPVIMNLTLIAGLVLGKGDINYLSSSYNCSIIFSALGLLLLCKIYGFKKIDLKVKILNQSVTRTMLLTIPLFFGGIVSEINEIIDRAFSAFYTEGVLTALRYGKLLEIFMVSALGIAVGQAVYPRISQLVIEKDKQALERLLSFIIEIFAFVIIPLFIGIIVMGDDLVKIVFMRGAFGIESAWYTSIAFIIYSISIFPVSINEILSRVYYAYNNTKKPVWFSIVAMGLNIVLNAFVVFGLELDFYGLAMTTSFCETVLAILLLIGVRKDLEIKISLVFKCIIFELFGALFMGIIILFIKPLIQNLYIRFISMTLIGLLVYFACMVVLNRKLMRMLYEFIWRKS